MKLKAVILFTAVASLAGCVSYVPGTYMSAPYPSGVPYVVDSGLSGYGSYAGDWPGYGGGFTINSSPTPYYAPQVIPVPVPYPVRPAHPRFVPRDRNGDGVINRADRPNWGHRPRPSMPTPSAGTSVPPPRPSVSPRPGPPRPAAPSRVPRATPLPNGSGP